MKENVKIFLTEMAHSEARNFFLNKEPYIGPNYPMYYNFNYCWNMLIIYYAKI